ncbi:MAG: hypothetical protein Q8N23_11760 [Archangium sp.]|nr:hypothetical protein [Archangium sp.]MDP3153342.1 hypothetical protein [Archangium sp.]MDP3573499.1 hypothetical protein [Archangium sp.]
MEPSQWLASFRVMHENARRGSLSEIDQKKYTGMRDELARSLMSSQGQPLPEGVAPRRAFSVAHVFPIEIGGVTRTTTREVSCQSFTALVSGTFKEGERVSFVMNLSRAADPLSGNALVHAVVRQNVNASRITCHFEALGEERLARLETALFDAAMSRF